MKVYQVTYYTPDEGNGGYSYFISKAEANKDAKHAQHNGHSVTVKALTVEISKRGLLRALNLYGGHPDNG